MQKLLKAFRAKGMPVVFVNAYTPTRRKLPVYGRFWPSLSRNRVNYLGTPDVEVIDELKPQAGEPLFYNWPFGIFQGNELEKYLAEQGVETIVLAGVATGMAVGAAASPSSTASTTSSCLRTRPPTATRNSTRSSSRRCCRLSPL